MEFNTIDLMGFDVPTIIETDTIVPVEENETEVEETEEVDAEVPKEEEPAEELEGDQELVEFVNELYDSGLIPLDELPESVKGKPFNKEEFMITVKEALIASKELSDKRATLVAEDTFKNIVNKMSPTTRKGFEYELNYGTEEGVKDVYKALLYEAEVTKLDPTDPIDQEKIVSQYYSDILGFDKSDVQEKLSVLKDSNSLQKEAALLKPKLDSHSQAIANKRLDEQKTIAAREEELQTNLESRTIDILKKGKVGSIPLTKELASFIYSAIVSDEVPVTVKGKTIDMPVAEALVRHHKYNTDKGSLERLMEALVFLQAPEEFYKHYAKGVETKETNKFIQDSRSDSNRKTGSGLFGKTPTSTPTKTNNNGLRMK